MRSFIEGALALLVALAYLTWEAVASFRRRK